MSETLTVIVDSVRAETDRVRSIALSHPDGAPLPPFEAGAHVDVHLGNALVRQYSLHGDPADRRHYRIGVLLEPESRGGSQWVFDHVVPGMALTIGYPRNNFPLAEAQHSLLIGGGIGVTPLLAMATELHRKGADFTLHYLTRSRSATAFLDLVSAAPWADRVLLHHRGGDPAKGLDLDALLRTPRADTRVYCCGPVGLMTAVREAAAAWEPSHIHFEWFSADPEIEAAAGGDKPFSVTIKSTGAAYAIPADRSIADVLQAAGLAVDTSCCEGICGACITPVLEGEVDHRDSILTEEERDEEGLMTLCCSRAKNGGTLVLDF